MNISLIREAQRLVTGAEIHKVNGLIAMMRGAHKDQDFDLLKRFEDELESIMVDIRRRRYAMLRR